MAVDVVIKQKGIFKTKLTLEDITNHQLGYGNYHYDILKEEELGDEITVYDPQHIARGISIVWQETNTNEVSLRLLIPTSIEEITLFYELIGRICKKWKAKSFEQDGEMKAITELEQCKNNIIDFSANTLEHFLKEYDDGCWFSARWPLYFNASIKERYLNNGLVSLGEWMHKSQNQDVYYARPLIYQDNDNNKIFALLVLTEDVRSIMPYKPIVPFGTVNPGTNDPLEIDDWRVSFASISEDKLLGEISFSFFSQYLENLKHTDYDAKTYLLEGLSLEKMKEILAKYHQSLN